MNSHQQKAAQFLAVAFGVVVLAISASTSFGFFYTFFDNLIPHSVLAADIAALISGVIGTLLFDVACAIWLFIFLHHSETPEQRAITLIMTVLTFIGSAAASVAYLGLTAGGDLALDTATRDTIATFALVVVIIGVIANFGAMQAYQRYSYTNKQRVMEADRRDLLQSAEDEQARYLDELITQQVKEILTAQAGTLAQQQARRIAAKFYRHEMAKYAGGEPLALAERSEREERGARRGERQDLARRLERELESERMELEQEATELAQEDALPEPVAQTGPESFYPVSGLGNGRRGGNGFDPFVRGAQ